MKFTTYDEVVKDSVAFDVQDRYADELSRVRALGFNDEFYLRETSFPLSAFLFFPVLIYMHFLGERVRIGGYLQAITFNPYLIHEDSYVYATIMKLGVLYASMFDDGTVLTTTSYDNGTKSQPEYRFIRQFSSTPYLEDAWRKHIWTVDRLNGEGRSVIRPIGMKDVTRIAQRIDKITTGLGMSEKEKSKKNG
jgi:hypothetical protein